MAQITANRTNYNRSVSPGVPWPPYSYYCVFPLKKATTTCLWDVPAQTGAHHFCKRQSFAYGLSLTYLLAKITLNGGVLRPPTLDVQGRASRRPRRARLRMPRYVYRDTRAGVLPVSRVRVLGHRAMGVCCYENVDHRLLVLNRELVHLFLCFSQIYPVTYLGAAW